jgi:primosomal protein N''
MASTDEITKAILEIRKDLAEATMRSWDHAAHMMAVEATLRALGPETERMFSDSLAVEQHKALAAKNSLQNDVQTIQKAIEIIDSRIMPRGPVN